MAWLITGLVLLLGVHLVPHFPTLRGRLVDRFGLWPYKGLFALISLLGLGLIVFGFPRADVVAIWEPPPWSSIAALAVMPVVFVLIIAAYAPTNIRRYLRHPMLTGVLLWAVTHLFANGDQASLLLFGGFALYAPFAMWSANRRGARLSDRSVPFGYDAAVVAAGMLVYAIVLYWHAPLFGAAVIQ